MTTNSDVLDRARDYASGDLSTLDLYEWLSGRSHPIEDDLEAELWGLAIAVDEEELTLDYAREWLRDRVERLDQVEAISTANEHRPPLLISIPSIGGITIETVSRLTVFASKSVSTTESWWRSVERRPLQAVPA